MSVRFYIGYVVVLLIIVGGVEATFGTLYARYVILYTGAIFMGGLMIGQRYEQAWLAGQRRRPGAGSVRGAERSS